MSMAAWQRARPWSLMALDVIYVFLYAKVAGDTYIELPSKDPLAGDGKFVGRVKNSLYGTRDAPQL